MNSVFRNPFEPDPVALATLHGVDHLEIAFVRHGQPLAMEARRPEQALDPPLTTLGWQQARAVARYLGPGTVALYASDLARAWQTAQPYADLIGLPVQQVAGLREVTIDADRLATPESRKFLSSRRWEDLPSAESSPEFRARVHDAVAGIATRHRPGHRVAVFCHSGVINVYLAQLLCIDQDYFFRPSHGSVTRVWVNMDAASILSVNEAAHVSGVLHST